ncbi:ABC transporter ATP-binding protein [Parasulfitobacter algicola]|nr:ABC transporter ATP-binding protein [Sulfitobacter algicola]
MILLSIEGVMVGAFALMMKPVFDDILVGQNTDAIWYVGVAIMTIFSIRAVAGIGQKLIMSNIVEKTSAQMQRELMRHLMTLDTMFHQKHPPGYLIERVQGDVRSINVIWRQFITGASRDVIQLITLFSVALYTDPLLTLIALVGIPLMVLPTILIQRYVRHATKDAREVAGKMSLRLDEVFHGINPVKLNSLENYQAGQYRNLLKERVDAEVKSAVGKAFIPAMVDILMGIGIVAILIYTGNEIASGETSLGDFMTFFVAITNVFDPLRRLAKLSGAWITASVNLNRMRDLFETKPTLMSPERPVPIPQKRPNIVLQNVEFSYGDLPVLHKASFTAEAGKTTALVGASGAGKSTIFNILTRLVDPQTGSVSIGGTEIKDIDLGELRNLFSVVTQDALLFDETIRDNILLGRKDVDETHLKSVLDAAHVSDFVAGLKDGLDTHAGPRGSALSGGQRQRVAIARALLRDTPILLLDEATSALDTQSEAIVQEALDKLSQGRTTLVIAHRLSTVRNADKIVVMNAGQAVEQGTHDDLLAKNGVYAALYNMQFRDET